MMLDLAPDELIIDNFAGGGGASTGIFMATGRHPDHAINHDAQAVAMHAANHPSTRHHCQSVWKADPQEIAAGRPVGLAWFSPDCKHFSKAKGGKPVEKHIRDLAWVVVLWAQRVKPRVILLENVEEFKDWGPLIESNDGKLRPCPVQKGMEFKRWVRELKRAGYKVEWRELRACDYGAPTIRKRLFVVARCDGKPIQWPAPTHGAPDSEGVLAGRLLPWRTAAEIIDWSLPCHSIFMEPAEARAMGLKRPLAAATMARIARGVKRYVIDAARPFIVPLTHKGDYRVNSVDEPKRTQTTAKRGEHALVSPTLIGVGGRAGQSRPRGADEPNHTTTSKYDTAIAATHLLRTDMASAAARNGIHDPTEPTRTQTTAGSFALAAATLVHTAHGERDAKGRKRGKGEKDIEAPMPTSTASPDIALVAPHLMTMRNAQKPYNEGNKPTHNITAGGAHLHMVAAHLTKFRTGATGSAADAPAPTVTANSYIQRPGGAPPLGVVSAFLAQHNGGSNNASIAGHAADAPVSTLQATGSQQQLVAGHMMQMRGSKKDGRDIEQPASAIMAQGNHEALVETRIDAAEAIRRFPGRAYQVAAFLAEYYGEGGMFCDAANPLNTIPTRDRFAVITVEGQEYIIADIGMRMLTPRELYSAQGFPADYKIEIDFQGRRLPKDAQVRMCGNSVCPDVAAALVRANFAISTPMESAAGAAE